MHCWCLQILRCKSSETSALKHVKRPRASLRAEPTKKLAVTKFFFVFNTLIYFDTVWICLGTRKIDPNPQKNQPKHPRGPEEAPLSLQRVEAPLLEDLGVHCDTWLKSSAAAAVSGGVLRKIELPAWWKVP